MCKQQKYAAAAYSHAASAFALLLADRTMMLVKSSLAAYNADSAALLLVEKKLLPLDTQLRSLAQRSKRNNGDIFPVN